MMFRRIVFLAILAVLSTLLSGCSSNPGKSVSPSTLSISGGALPLAIAQHSYTHTVTASGGVLNYQFELDHGLLPPGIVAEWVDNALVIHGTGTQAGSYSVPVTVVDANKDRATATLVIEVAADNDISGTWSMVITVTLATEACAGEEGTYPAVPVTIVQVGSALTVSGFLGDPGVVLTGSIGGVNGNVVTVSGTYPEDSGTTTATHVWTLTSLNHMSGTEAWNWTNGATSCPGSRSTVVCTR